MIGEPQRSQYLDAMGLTAWVSRYRLPNAAPTRECEWLEPEEAPNRPPGERLQELLGEPREPPASPATSSPATPSRHARRARALLGDEPEVAAPEARAPAEGEPSGVPVPAETKTTPRDSLRFSLQIAALDGRWLVMLPAGQAPTPEARRLLANLLQAARIEPGGAPDFQAFDWPMMEGLPVEAPLEEARDGLRAFVDGRRRRGWRPERLMLFGQHDTLAPVLDLQDGHCRLLDIPGWQGPSLGTLARSAEAKRELWPWLLEWRHAWHQAAGGEGDDAEA
ncbi:hypothetical protein SAMN02745148_00911 [Modicisalibacter ilicicola DSM 19980]|uniref:Uncharacterized protein n=1 Tax=Modicisalibacter ilicicola DSM 19980 TaxID=1121942 RepID=A0A1M4V9S9_9GAMM|nr:hypothetical protein [Halomonas ilicicola]SHE65682.1 hypothetical protein SAMN02745148_00911 [Halomonas ilicicola DSM 19980]